MEIGDYACVCTIYVLDYSIYWIILHVDCAEVLFESTVRKVKMDFIIFTLPRIFVIGSFANTNLGKCTALTVSHPNTEQIVITEEQNISIAMIKTQIFFSPVGNNLF